MALVVADVQSSKWPPPPNWIEQRAIKPDDLDGRPVCVGTIKKFRQHGHTFGVAGLTACVSGLRWGGFFGLGCGNFDRPSTALSSLSHNPCRIASHSGNVNIFMPVFTPVGHKNGLGQPPRNMPTPRLQRRLSCCSMLVQMSRCRCRWIRLFRSISRTK